MLSLRTGALGSLGGSKLGWRLRIERSFPQTHLRFLRKPVAEGLVAEALSHELRVLGQLLIHPGGVHRQAGLHVNHVAAIGGVLESAG